MKGKLELKIFFFVFLVLEEEVHHSYQKLLLLLLVVVVKLTVGRDGSSYHHQMDFLFSFYNNL